MNPNIYKLLRNLSKILLIVIGVGLVGYLGYLGYMSYKNPPYKVTVSNITDSSFTVSWVTDTPTKGYVYYKEKNSFLPGPFGWINSGVAYDDRDWAYNQSVCVNEFNANSEVDDTFTVVNSENFDCEDIKVEEIEDFFTHHITLKNLDAEKEYYFRIGNGFWNWNVDEGNFAKTFNVLEEVKEPSPMFGRIVVDGYGGDIDSIAYIRFYNQRGEKTSVLYSSATNDEGGWYFDAANTRTENGDMVDILSGEDMVAVSGQFTNLDLSDLESWVYGYYDGAYPDIEIVYNEEDALESYIIGKAYARPIEDVDMTPPKKTTSPVKSPVAAKPSVKPPVPPKLPASPASSGGDASVKEKTTQHKTTKTTEVEMRKDLCPDCSSFVTSEQMRFILDTPELYASKYVGVIGAGNVSRIFAAAGVPIGKEVLALMGLSYNAGNINALGLNQRNVAKNSDGSKAKAMSQGEFDILTNNGENSTVFISAKTSVDSLGNKTVVWNAPYSKKIPSGVSLNITKDDEGKFLLGGIKLTDIAQDYSLVSISEKIKKNFETCKDKQNCEISVQTIQVMLSSDAFGKYINKLVTDCESKNVECDSSKIKEHAGKIVDSFVSSYKSYLNSMDGEVLPEKQVINNTTKVIKKGEANINYPDKYYQNVIHYIVNYEQMSKKEQPKYTGMEFEVNENGLLKPNEAMEEVLKNAEVVEIVGEYKGTFSSTDIIAEQWIPPLIEHYCKENLKGCVEFMADRTNIDLPEGLFAKEKTEEYGNLEEEIGKLEDIKENLSSQSLDNKKPLNRVLSFLKNFFPKEIVEASEENAENPENTFFFIPEYGAYTLELGPFKYEESVTDGEKIYLFYIELNGEEGFQLPPEGYTGSLVGYDTLLKSIASEITYSKTASAKNYDLKEGINIVSFDFVPSYNNSSTYTAKNLVKQTGNQNIEFIAKYDSGRWAEGISCKGTEGCFGTDFSLTPGRGYVIRVSEDTEITIPGYEILDPVPINYSTGWNLVGVHGYSQAYTAGSLIESINKVEGLTADNISWWPTSKGKYEGLQVTDGTTYGLDFPISPKNGYFVRISKFTPPSEECRSIIWHEGGNLNGACGDSKSLF